MGAGFVAEDGVGEGVGLGWFGGCDDNFGAAIEPAFANAKEGHGLLFGE